MGGSGGGEERVESYLVQDDATCFPVSGVVIRRYDYVRKDL